MACSSETCTAYIDTTSVIGNGNLMERVAVSETQKFLSAGVELGVKLEKLYGSVKVEEPNADISSFHAIMLLAGHPKGIEINTKHLLVRGSVLKNTTWALGFIVYAGHMSKSQMNIRTQAKYTTRMEKRLNRWVLYLLSFEFILVVISMFLYFFASKSEFESYLFLGAFVRFLLLYCNILPISLFLLMDIVRQLQSVRISLQMNGKVQFKTADLNETLGQIEYIVTDKTGTLTENQLVLKACYIGLEQFMDEDPCDSTENRPSNSDDHRALTTKSMSEAPFSTTHTEKNEHGNPDANNSFERLKNSLEKENPLALKTHFVRCLAVCNSVTVQWNKYYGPSADEVALAEGAAKLGYALRNKTDDQIEVECPDGAGLYTIINMSDFKGETQQSKIIIKRDDEDHAFLYIKGSAEAMIEYFEHSADLALTIRSQIETLSNIGLRTMVLAYKQLSAQELTEFKNKVKAAKNSLLNRDLKLDNAYKDLELNLEFLGITGIEDVVLSETKSSISELREAGIKI